MSPRGSDDFADTLRMRAELVNGFLRDHFSSGSLARTLQKNLPQHVINTLPRPIEELNSAITYSLLQPGAKRFRSVLAMLTAEALGYSSHRVLPFAGALECIHTYSLIHDDLPSMDNDDFRRGQPTNHKVFGEAFAILAGDALATEAFAMIAKGFRHEPVAALDAIEMLANAVGPCGMAGGQMLDLYSKESGANFDLLKQELTHNLKTGALITVAALGSARLCFANDEKLNQIRRYASALGLAFQVADDLLDHNPDRPEAGSYVSILGFNQTKEKLQSLTEEALLAIESWGSAAEPLREMSRYNLSRML